MKEEMEINSWVEILVDNMEDAFNKEFAAWPIRYFIAKEGRLLHKTENSIANSLFDQDTIQNFFKRLRSIEIDKQMKSTSDEIDKQLRSLPEPQRAMLHFSSIGNLPDDPQPLLGRHLKVKRTTEDALRLRSTELIAHCNEINKQMRLLPEPQITMLHFSSLGNFPDHPTPTPWRTSIFFFLFSQRRRRLKLGLCVSLLFVLLLPFYLYRF